MVLGDLKSDLASIQSSNVFQHKVTPVSLGIGTAGNYMDIIIPANTRVPVSRVKRYFYTAVNHYSTLGLDVYKGEDKKYTNNERVATFLAVGIPIGSHRAIEITFTVDEDYIITVTGRDGPTGKDLRLTKKS